MTPAFCSAPPLRAPRSQSLWPPRRLQPRRRPRVVASDSSALTPPSSLPPPSPPPSTPPAPPPAPPASRALRVAHPFVAALYDAFARRDASLLQPLLAADVGWSTALFDVRGADRVLDNLDDFLAFAVDPTIALFDVRPGASPHSLVLSWTLSFNYPLPWRPRVSVSATTALTLQPSPARAVVTEMADEWHVAPFTLVAQALPKLTDLFWLYPSPHAETDRGQRRRVRSASAYVVFQQAPLDEYRIRATAKRFEHELIWAMPALPSRAFEGGLRKLEQYSAVSPIALRLVRGEAFVGDEELLYEWALPVPTTLTGSSEVLAALPKAEHASVVSVPQRLMAVRRFGGMSTRTRVKEQHRLLLDALAADGVVSGDEEVLQFGGRNVWVRCYDCKVGFNCKGVLSMAMYGGSRGVRRVNEIAFDLTGIVSEESLRS